MLTVAQKKEAE